MATWHLEKKDLIGFCTRRSMINSPGTLTLHHLWDPLYDHSWITNSNRGKCLVFALADKLKLITVNFSTSSHAHNICIVRVLVYLILTCQSCLYYWRHREGPDSCISAKEWAASSTIRPQEYALSLCNLVNLLNYQLQLRAFSSIIHMNDKDGGWANCWKKPEGWAQTTDLWQVSDELSHLWRTHLFTKRWRKYVAIDERKNVHTEAEKMSNV